MGVYHYIYALPLGTTVLFAAALVMIWGGIGQMRRQRWPLLNAALLVLSVLAVLQLTLFSRSVGEYDVILRPFAALDAAKVQPEIYRELLMNMLLFLPIGLTLPNAMPNGMNTALKMGITVLFGFVLSLGIEYAQYRFSLGLVETDDVICNTVGTLLGSASLLFGIAAEKFGKVTMKAMTLTSLENEFLNITAAAVNGRPYTLPRSLPVADIFALAAEQKLLPFVFYALRDSAHDDDAALFAETKQQVRAQVIGQTMRSLEFAELYAKLREAGLRPLVVKGAMCSRLYPLCDHRISGDDDAFAGLEFAACHERLISLGLEADAPADELDTADEVGYGKKDSPIYIELHRNLFDSAEDAHDDLNRFFADVAPVEVDGFLTLPPHEHFLYLILHAYKHFVVSGVGLRQFCDIGLWAKAYRDEIDWPLLHRQCASVHADVFAATVLAIVRHRLGIEFSLPAPWDEGVTPEPLLHDTLCGGIYGSSDSTRIHSATVTLNAVKSDRKGQKSGVLRSVFPKKSYLERRYPYLKTHPSLLPLAWVQRMAHYAGERKNAVSSGSASVKLAKQRIELMRLYGIMK